MTQRRLYLAAYDVSDAKRLHQALHIVRDYATGGQKSVHECFLTEHERQELLHRLHGLLKREDRFLLMPIAPRRKPRAWGVARAPVDPRYFYLG